MDYLDVIEASKKVNFLLGIRRPTTREKKLALDALLMDFENPKVFCYHSGYEATIKILLQVSDSTLQPTYLQLLREERQLEVLSVAVKCLTHLAIRLQKKFAPYVKQFIQLLYDQFMGKLLHPVLVECVNACNAIFDASVS